MAAEKVSLLSVVSATALACVLISIASGHAIPHLSTLAQWSSLSGLLYLVLWRSILYPLWFSPLRDVPTVPGCPLWGQFFSIITEECGVPQRRWHAQHGTIIRYFFPFGAERLSVADDEALKHMTVKNPYNYPKPVRAKLWMVRILGEGVLLAEGHEHVRQRKALAHAFSTQSIRALMPVFWEKALTVARLWHQEMADAAVTTRSVEVLEWLNRCTLDIIGKAGFGCEIGSLEDPDVPLRQAYRLVFAFDLFSRMLHGIQAFVPASKYIPAKMNRDMETARGIILDAATAIIAQKFSDAANNRSTRDILGQIAKENKKLKDAGEPVLSFETMRDQIMTFLGAGHDTTATGVAWTIHLLSIHPDVQTRLRDEIRSYMPFLFDRAAAWTFEDDEMATSALADPDRLPYLGNVCREALRFIPPIPMTVRQSLEDDTLGPFRVPGGTVIYVMANAINRMPLYWGETADEFDPDRWDRLPKSVVPNAYMTFLQGPRGCIGRKFAETEMKVLLCALLSMYEFERDEGHPDPEKWKMWRLVLRPKWGVTVRTRLLGEDE